MNAVHSNIFANIPEELPDELFETLLKKGRVQIERIISRNHTTKAGYWFDQDWDEWVILLQGRAKLRYKNLADEIELIHGDYILIPAHTLHRVEWTDPEIDTVWLAIHLAD